jgi:hypothetical protein
MIFSSDTSLFVLALAAACNAVPSATVTGVINLGTAKNYVILTNTGIFTVPYSVITEDIGVSPILAAAAITGSNLTMDSGLEYSTSGQITGKVYLADYATPIPAALSTAVSNMETAYTGAEGRPKTDALRIDLGVGLLGGALAYLFADLSKFGQPLHARGVFNRSRLKTVYG